MKAILISAAAALLVHGAGHAQIYKWVDASGKTHYSDKKDAAGTAKVGALRHAPTPVAASSAPASSAPGWKEREREYRWRQRQAARDSPAARSAPKRPSESYDSNQIDTDKAKCELARNVTSGAAVHTNGARTDANDRQIAARDIQTFCR
jgi:hypothetical protein